MDSIAPRRRTSNRVTDLTELDLDWLQVSLKESKDRAWFPNRVFHHQVTKEVVINSQNSGEGKQWSLKCKALEDVIAAEQVGKIPQAYVRLSDYNGHYIAQETAQNVWRWLKNAPRNSGAYGEYWWVNENFEPQVPINPNDQLIPF